VSLITHIFVWQPVDSYPNEERTRTG